MARHNSEAGASTTKAIFNDNLHGEESPDLEQVKAQAKALVGGAAADEVDKAGNVQSVYEALIRDLAGSDEGKNVLHKAVHIMLEAGTITSNEEMPGVLAALVAHAGYKNLNAYIQKQSGGTLCINDRTMFASIAEMEKVEEDINSEHASAAGVQKETMQSALQMMRERRALAIEAGLDTAEEMESGQLEEELMAKAEEAANEICKAKDAFAVPRECHVEAPTQGIRSTDATVNSDQAYVMDWVTLRNRTRALVRDEKVRVMQEGLTGEAEANRVAKMVELEHAGQLYQQMNERQEEERETFSEEMQRVGIEESMLTEDPNQHEHVQKWTPERTQKAIKGVEGLRTREDKRAEKIKEVLSNVCAQEYSGMGPQAVEDHKTTHVDDMLAYTDKQKVLSTVRRHLDAVAKQHGEAVKLLFNHGLHKHS